MFKITIDGKELKKVIEKVVCNMDKKTNFDIYKKVILTDNNGTLHTYTNKLESFLETVSTNYISQSDCVSNSIGIDVNDLKMLLKMKNEVIITEKNDTIEVHNGTRNIFLMKYDISDFPEVPCDIFTNVLKFKECEFAETINNLNTFTSDGNNNNLMQCINFNLTDGRIETLDGHRIGMKIIQENEKLVHDGKVLVNNIIVSDLKKALNKKSELEVILSESEKYVQLKGDSFTYIQAKIKGDFFNLQGMLNGTYDISFTMDNSKMLDIVKYYTDNIIKKTDKNPIVFKIDDDNLYTYAKNERLEMSDSMEIEEHVGKDLLIGFNPYFWLDVMKVIDSDVSNVKCLNQKSPTIISGNEYSFLILPVNLGNEAEEKIEKYFSKLVA